jgi:hypothetical protein
MLLYAVAEVSFRHRIIRYLKAGKGTSFHQLLDIRQAIQQTNPELIAVAIHGDKHISGASTEQDEELLLEYFQSSEFLTERLIWTKETYSQALS